MKRTGVTTRYWLATLALATLVSTAGAQTQGTQPQDRDSDLTWRQLSAFDQFLDNHPEVSDQLRQNPALVDNQEFVENHPALKQYLQDHPEVREELNQNPNAVMHQEQRFDRREDRDRDAGRDRDRDGDRDMTRGELSKMDRFLDSHPEIGEQVRKNPSLLDDRRFVENHPALQEFLATHSGVREEIRENPNAFMSAEGRYDRREDMRLASTMDQFLDNHQEIAEQLRKNPALVNDKEFVENHAALQQFLAAHPELRQDFKSNPNAFMQREERFDRREDSMRDPDVTRTELANMDRFMDGHPEIAEQLRKNPALVNNKEFVENHPALQQFLASHPGVREEYRENPSAFMHQEQRFDQRQDAGFRRDGDVTRGELSSFHEFLQGHGNISTELSRNPSLINDEEYVENHPALQTYLKTNPQVKEELKENPQSFVTSAQTFDSGTSATTTDTTRKKTTIPSKGTAKPAAPQK